MGNGRDPSFAFQLDKDDRIGESAEQTVSRSVVVFDGVELRIVSHALESRFEFAPELAAESDSLRLVVGHRHLELRFGVGVEDRKFHG